MIGGFWNHVSINKTMVSCEQERIETCRINLKGTERAVVAALSLIVTKNGGRGCPCQLYDNVNELHEFEEIIICKAVCCQTYLLR